MTFLFLSTISPPPLQGTDTPQWLVIVLWIFGALLTFVSGASVHWLTFKAKTAELQKEKEKLQQEHTNSRESLAQAQEREFYKTVLEQLKSLKLENQDLQTKLISVEHQVKTLAKQLEFYENNPAVHEAREILSSLINSVFKRPAWIHDITNAKWYVNEAYATRFDIQRKDFWTPINIYALFPEKVAMEYVQHDLDVIKSNIPLERAEIVRSRITDPNCNVYVQMRIRKVPLRVRDSSMIFGELLEERLASEVKPKNIEMIE